MLKKLLILPLVGGLMSITAFASANDLIGTYSYNTDSNQENIISIPSGVSQLSATLNIDSSDGGFQCKVFLAKNGGYFLDKFFTSSYSNGSSTYIVDGAMESDCTDYAYGMCTEIPLSVSSNVLDISDVADDVGELIVQCEHGAIVGSVSLYSVSSSSDDDNSSIIPEIPNSFTSGLTSLVNNFGGIIVNWLPTIILLSLGIYAIFALFRVVRNYAKSSFNG